MCMQRGMGFLYVYIERFEAFSPLHLLSLSRQMVLPLLKMFPVLRFVFVVVSTVKRGLEMEGEKHKRKLLMMEMIQEKSSFINWTKSFFFFF